MFVPPQFEETRFDVLAALIDAHPLGTLVTLGADGLNANHIPFLLDPDPAPHGTLIGHVSRANPAWSDFDPQVQALVVFQGADSYITPSWYPTKQQTGKVVPTWNYAVVHAYGLLRIVEDAARLRAIVERLTAQHEAARPKPWKVSDAPPEYIEQMLCGIVGIEIEISRLVGKWKTSQNRDVADRNGVVQGLSELNDANAAAMAELVRRSNS
jgi:transcriptional regulator